MNQPVDIAAYMHGVGEAARAAARVIAAASTDAKNAALLASAAAIRRDESKLLAANAEDVAAAAAAGQDAAFVDRLRLMPKSIAAMAEGLEQIAALPRSKPRKTASRKAVTDRNSAPPTKATAKKPPSAQSTPRPDRTRLTASERAVAEADQRHAKAQQSLAREIDALQKKRRRMEAEQAREIDRLRQARDKAEASYQRALRDWEG